MKKYFETDGVDHVNIHWRGKTYLGRWLSLSASCYLDMAGEDDGEFKSILGYWLFLLSNDEQCRTMHDYKCFDLVGRLTGAPLNFENKFVYSKKHTEDKDFQRKIKLALDQKIKSSDFWMQEMVKSELPFTLYERLGDDKIIDNTNHKKFSWLIKHIVNRCNILKERGNARNEQKTTQQ